MSTIVYFVQDPLWLATKFILIGLVINAYLYQRNCVLDSKVLKSPLTIYHNQVAINHNLWIWIYLSAEHKAVHPITWLFEHFDKAFGYNTTDHQSWTWLPIGKRNDILSNLLLNDWYFKIKFEINVDNNNDIFYPPQMSNVQSPS